MFFTRTANAGGLLTLGDATILLDGVCNLVEPYSSTPDAIRKQLLAQFPNVVAFTHAHPDHFDGAFSQAYHATTHRPIYGPVNLPFAIPAVQAVNAGSFLLTSIVTRHLGKPGQGEHVSFLLEGSRRIWFMGDAAPPTWQSDETGSILFAPFAYANTPLSWRKVCSAGFQTVVLLHMPEPEKDTYGLWDSVNAVTAETSDVNIYIPQMGETLEIPIV